MTVSTTTSSVGPYSCNGSTTEFPVTFPFLEDDDLVVYLIDNTGASTTLTIDTHYTVTGAGGSSGTVTTVATYASGNTILIDRVVDLLQETDLENQATYYPEVLEDALDKLTMIAQQLYSGVSRSIKFPTSDLPITDPVLPSRSDRLGKFLQFDLYTGQPIATPQTISVADYTGMAFETVADLRLSDPDSLVTGQMAVVAGYYAAGDGGGGPLRVWQTSGAPYTDNGGSIIVPTGGDGSGAWVWEWSGAVNVKWFGAKGDGVTDDTESISSAIDHCVGSGCPLIFPSSTTDYLCDEVEIDGTIVISGDGIEASKIRPIQSAGNVCFLLTENAAKSKISDLTFTREFGDINIGTAIELQAANIQIENVEFVHNEYGIAVTENFYYHKYTNVLFKNNSAFLASATSNNNNSLIQCYFGNRINIANGNDLTFYNCDFSSNPGIGNKPFVFTDPVSVNFFGCYSEVIDTVDTGTFDLFEFKEVTNTGIIRSVQVHGTFAKGLSGKYDSLFVFDKVKASIYGGYVTGYVNIAETANGGEVVLFNVKKQGSVLYFPATSSGSVFDNGAVRLDTSVSTPIASGDTGYSIYPTGSEVNASVSAASTPIHKTSKAANSGTTRHYELYSGTTLAGSIVIDGNNEIRLVSHAASGRACLVETGGQRLDVLSGFVRPSTDNTVSLGGTGNRWANVYSGKYYSGANLEGKSGTFTSSDGKTITVTGGIITNIA